MSMENPFLDKFEFFEGHLNPLGSNPPELSESICSLTSKESARVIEDVTPGRGTELAAPTIFELGVDEHNECRQPFDTERSKRW